MKDFSKYINIEINEEGKILKGAELWDLPKDFTFFPRESTFELDTSFSNCVGLQYLDLYLRSAYPIKIESVNIFEKNKGTSKYYSNSFSLTTSFDNKDINIYLLSTDTHNIIINKGFTLKGVAIGNLERLPSRLKEFMKVFDVEDDNVLPNNNLKLNPLLCDNIESKFVEFKPFSLLDLPKVIQPSLLAHYLSLKTKLMEIDSNTDARVNYQYKINEKVFYRKEYEYLLLRIIDQSDIDIFDGSKINRPKTYSL